MGAWGFGPFDNDGIRDVVCYSHQPSILKENLIRLLTDREYCSVRVSEPGYMVSAFLMHSLGVNLPCFKTVSIEEIKTVLKGKYKIVGNKLIFSDNYDPFKKYELNGKKVHVGEMGASMIGATLIPVSERIKILEHSLSILFNEWVDVARIGHGWDDPITVMDNMHQVYKAGTELLNEIKSKISKTFEVVEIGRNNNKIVSYMLRDCTGKKRIVDANLLKENMIHNGVTLTNYTLTSDKRLVPKKKEI